MRETIGNFLLRRLEEAGIRHIFGVPGDFNLELMQQLEDRAVPKWVGNCNELNGAYAADGYARLKGLGALIVTNGVGALSAINGIAGAYAEHVPVICICGSIPLKSIARQQMMHHTFADGSHNNFFRAFAEVTAAQAQLNQANAAGEIDRIISTAWRLKRPVYLELPSDLSYLEIETPNEPIQLLEPVGDTERIQSCAAQIASRLKTAKAPALLLDMDTDRFHVEAEVAALAEKLQLPVATLAGSKGVFSEESPLFAGVYSGGGGEAHLKKVVEESDCLITVGFRRVDSTSGFFTDKIPDDAIHLNAYTADIEEDHYEAIVLRPLLLAITAAMEPAATPYAAPTRSQLAQPAEEATGTLRQTQYWQAFQAYLCPGDVIIAEDGTSSSGAGALQLPEGCTFITQAIWGSIGYTLGSLLGALVAAPERRHILFIGDGSFQLTAQELSTILRNQLKPQIFLINNGGYTIERTILGKDAKYNDVANWSYAELPKVFSQREVHSVVVKSESELLAILHGESKEFLFVESLMAPDDAPLGLIKGGHASAATDYGPRGPQSRAGSQIDLPQQDGRSTAR